MGTENDSKLRTMSFVLPEGPQMIIDSKKINANEYYVRTLGNGPKSMEDTTSETSATEKVNAGKQLFNSIRNCIPGLKKNTDRQNQPEDDFKNIKVRYFKLSILEGINLEGTKCAYEEFVTPQDVCKVINAMTSGLEQ